MRSSRYTLLQEMRFWKALGIFLSATRLPSRESVTALRKKKVKIQVDILQHELFLIFLSKTKSEKI